MKTIKFLTLVLLSSLTLVSCNKEEIKPVINETFQTILNDGEPEFILENYGYVFNNDTILFKESVFIEFTDGIMTVSNTVVGDISYDYIMYKNQGYYTVRNNDTGVWDVVNINYWDNIYFNTDGDVENLHNIILDLY